MIPFPGRMRTRVRTFCYFYFYRYNLVRYIVLKYFLGTYIRSNYEEFLYFKYFSEVNLLTKNHIIQVEFKNNHEVHEGGEVPQYAKIFVFFFSSKLEQLRVAYVLVLYSRISNIHSTLTKRSSVNDLTEPKIKRALTHIISLIYHQKCTPMNYYEMLHEQYFIRSKIRYVRFLITRLSISAEKRRPQIGWLCGKHRDDLFFRPRRSNTREVSIRVRNPVSYVRGPF